MHNFLTEICEQEFLAKVASKFFNKGRKQKLWTKIKHKSCKKKLATFDNKFVNKNCKQELWTWVMNKSYEQG